MSAISFGRGVRKPQTSTREIPSEDPVGTLELLLERHRGDEAWWSGGVFEGNHRADKNWRGALALGVDLDYRDDNGAHSTIPDGSWFAVASAAQDGTLPGNLVHGTPRGARVIFALNEAVADPNQMRRVILGAAAVVSEALAELGLTGQPGLEVDVACCDLARLFFAPKATVHGQAREATILRVRDEPYDPAELEAAAPEHEPTPEPSRNGPVGAGSNELIDAVQNFNTAYPMALPRSGGDCPACGHGGCFGSLEGDTARWACFSANHEADSGGIGTRGAKCWTGDALDLELVGHVRPVETIPQARARILRESGYLVSKSEKSSPPAAAPAESELDTDPPESIERPEIEIIVIEPVVIDAGIAALVQHAKGLIYQRGGCLVHVGRQPAVDVGERVNRPAGSPVVRFLEHPRLQELLSGAAEWKRFDLKAKEWVNTRPPEWVGRRVLSRPDWPFPVLAAVTEAPTLRPDGTLLDRPGYDDRSGILFEPCGLKFPTIRKEPTRDHARAALDAILDPLEDFPFVSDADRAVAVAAILGPFARNAITGPVPLIAFGAHAPGTGKSLLAYVIGVIATGRPMPAIAASTDVEEMRKGLLSLAMSGDPLVLFDNVEGEFGSAPLAGALTAGVVRDRILGRTQHVEAPIRICWYATGNNIRWRGDLGRRVLPCDIDAEVEHPEDRQNFRYPNLLAHVLEQRPRLVAAALTILRAHAVADSPRHGGPRLGSFESWDDAIRSAVVWVLGEDPIATRERVREQQDLDLDELRSLLATWGALFGDSGRTIAQAWEAAQAGGELAQALKESLVGVGGIKDGELNIKSTGRRFTAWLGRVAGGYRLVRRKGHGGIWQWRAEAIEGVQ